jgi:glycosyltransferase involved in cell wall biosynthesis
MGKIILATNAFNAGKTLHRTIDSVLSQTYGDFSYYLYDNKSTDETFEIMCEYERLDSRIHVSKIPENIDAHKYERALKRTMDNSDWFANLDADDDYAPGFLEEMLGFAQAQNLDFCVCRSNFIDEATGQTKNEYELLHDIVIEGEDFGTRFPDYFRFMGAMWGKLVKGALFHRMDWAEGGKIKARWNLSHRGDTLTILWYLQYSKRAGVLARLLHNYRQYPFSASKKNIDGKIRDNHRMPEVYRDFLRTKIGFVSEENEKYIGEVFERSMRRTLQEKMEVSSSGQPG